MATKLEQTNERLQKTITRARERAKERESEFVRKGVGAMTAFGLGALKKNGKLASLPTIPGVPRIGTVAIVATGAAFMTPGNGKLRQALDGIGEAATYVAAFEWGQGNDVAGWSEPVAGDDVEGRRRKARAQVADMQQRLADLEAQLAQQVSSNDYGAYGNYLDVPGASQYAAA